MSPIEDGALCDARVHDELLDDATDHHFERVLLAKTDRDRFAQINLRIPPTGEQADFDVAPAAITFDCQAANHGLEFDDLSVDSPRRKTVETTILDLSHDHHLTDLHSLTWFDAKPEVEVDDGSVVAV